MDPFEREAHPDFWLPPSLFGIGLALTAFALLWHGCDPWQALRVDRCVDRRGSYDDEVDVCGFERNRPASGGGGEVESPGTPNARRLPLPRPELLVGAAG